MSVGCSGETTPPSLPFAVGRWRPPGEQTVSDEWGGGVGRKNMTNAWRHSHVKHEHTYFNYRDLAAPDPPSTSPHDKL